MPTAPHFSKARLLARIGVFSGLIFAWLLASGQSVRAGTNLPIALTGFNRDVVIENTASGPPYGAATNFNAGETTCFYQTNLSGKTHGLPLNGSFINTNDNTVYQLQPYTSNNVLDFSSDTGLTSGTLFVVTPKVYDSIAIIANSGNGDATGQGTVTLHFNDGTSFTTNYYAPDWFNNSNPALYTIALQGFERITLATGGVSGTPGNPRFYQTAIPLTNIPGIATKRLSSLTFTKPGTANSTGIYAVSGATNASQTPLTYTSATLTNLSASGLTTTSANLSGQVFSTGNDAPMVTFYYGTTDGGANTAAWQNSVSVGWQTFMFGITLSNLTQSTKYFYTAQAINAGGTSWVQPSQSFTTTAPTPPTVTVLPASGISANYAELNGNVVSTGGNIPTVTIFYGTTDGGNNPAAWANSISAGPQSGFFARGAFGLSPSTTYFYTVRGVNSAGTGWASPSQSFTTLASNPVLPPVAVMTQHNDNNRSGDNLNETQLNTSNVNTNSFGLLYSRPVDDQVYAQPLVVTNVTIPGKGTHNILYICTVNDTVYAYDADDPTVTTPYWQTNLVPASPAGSRPPRNTDMTGACGGAYSDYSGAFGIVGTPAIDPVSKTMYFVARTLEAGTYVQRLYALDITTGTNRVSPAVISATFNGGAIFDPQKNNQRSAICLANGNLFICWSSHCDWGPYHGWVMCYNSTNLTQVTNYCDTATGGSGGIWMSGQAPAADTNGNIFISTGNGTVDASNSPTNRAMSFLKLNGTNLSMMSFFTPFNYSTLNGGDWDLGAGGIMLIPGTNLAVGGGKSSSTIPAHLYVVNRDNMGGLGVTADTNIVQSIPVTPTGLGVNHIHGAPVWWDGPDGSYIYVWGESDHLHQYKFDKVNGVFIQPAVAQSPTPAWVNGMTGGMLAISANGTNAGTGILWGSHQFTGDANQAVRPGIVHAYDAQNVTNELWNSEQFSARDSIGLYAKFVPPTVANSKVYMATFSGRVNVYGLLPGGRPLIYQSPSSSTRYTGDLVPLGLAAGGGQPLSFQWKLNGNPIPGATQASYIITNLQFSQAGVYTCTVSNAAGTSNSSPTALTVATKPTVSYSQVVMADGPIAYWRLDETNGTVAHDSVGGHDGQYNSAKLGQPGYNTNDPDTSVEFGTLAATDSYVGGINGIDFSSFANTSTFSVEVWVNGESFTQTAGAGIVACGYGSGGEQFYLDCGGTGNGFRFGVRDATNVAHNASGSTVANATWQHVVGVCDEPNGAVKLYVNGALNTSTSITGGIQMGTTPVSIGSREANFRSTYTMNFQGLIDEVAIYGYPLNAAQVQNHYLAGINPTFTLNMSASGGSTLITWSPGTLQSSTNVHGPYTNVTGATSPYTVLPTDAARFYRLHIP